MPLSTTDLLALLAAIPLAALGGEFFLKGVLGVASLWRLPKLLVATSLAAFATSSPELTVSTMAAIAGRPEIGLGDALGSNVVNIALILGLALLFGTLPAHLNELRRDFIFALAVPILLLVLAADGTLSRIEGAFLLMLFAFWLVLIAKQATKHRRDTTKADTESPGKPTHAWLFLLVGLTCLLLAGHLFVTGASGIAAALGMHNYVIGATVVAIGTSLPELVTTLLSRWRGHANLGLGILLGSNLFNGLAIVGIAAVIHPIQAPPREVSVALVVGVLSVLLILPRNGVISRQRGFCLLAAYMAYVVATLTR
ncbi:calcium/sodium antiporter [Nitrosovibrio sp. Nv4]|uniref:calcium/sodium antiporter n=1 Tax=Nitrosovibrio sp. Nv4 TaxID=1945880 RepID=UPI000BCD8184|nr:calcium/sodium antiporter [Nitrosovibrio sp. Nv4]SOD41512.1 cation:H+ antiporter [Nitrosovibrio sp. Nv4]